MYPPCWVVCLPAAADAFWATHGLYLRSTFGDAPFEDECKLEGVITHTEESVTGNRRTVCRVNFGHARDRGMRHPGGRRGAVQLEWMLVVRSGVIHGEAMHGHMKQAPLTPLYELKRIERVCSLCFWGWRYGGCDLGRRGSLSLSSRY